MSMITDPTRVEHEMAADKHTPTPAPDKCEGCLCTTINRVGSQLDAIYFECGQRYYLWSNKWERDNSEGVVCTRSVAAAVALRVRVGELEKNNDALRVQMTLVADWFRTNAPDEIHEGSAGENAVRHMTTLAARLARVTEAAQESMIPIAVLVLETGTHKYLSPDLLEQLKRCDELLRAALAAPVDDLAGQNRGGSDSAK